MNYAKQTPTRRPTCGGCLCPVAECACAYLRPRSKEGVGRPRGRPPVEDKRKPRGGFNNAEWAEVKLRASEAGMTAAAWVRMRTLEQ